MKMKMLLLSPILIAAGAVVIAGAGALWLCVQIIDPVPIDPFKGLEL